MLNWISIFLDLNLMCGILFHKTYMYHRHFSKRVTSFYFFVKLAPCCPMWSTLFYNEVIGDILQAFFYDNFRNITFGKLLLCTHTRPSTNTHLKIGFKLSSPFCLCSTKFFDSVFYIPSIEILQNFYVNQKNNLEVVFY